MDQPPSTVEHARPLRVLHLALAADAGGLTRYITTLGAAMRAQGHAVYAAGDDGAWRHAFDEAGLPYEQLPLSGISGLRRSIGRMHEWLKAQEVDVIHTHYRRATFLGRRLQMRLPRDRRPPLLYTLHLSHINVRGWRRLLTDFGDHTHAASQDAVDWLVSEARVPRRRITLIPHGIDASRFPRRTDADRHPYPKIAHHVLLLPLTAPTGLLRVPRLRDESLRRVHLDGLRLAGV